MNNETPPNQEFTTPNAPQTEAVSNVLGEAMRESDPTQGQTTVPAQEDLTAYHALWQLSHWLYKEISLPWPCTSC